MDLAVLSLVEFYDGLAPDYHLVYGDGWDAAVARQSTAVDRLIRAARPDATDVLDCSCGIGTQAIGLARLGYRVCGTDISPRSIERARVEARRLGAELEFAVADFRDLAGVAGEFDVVISCDNALPHVLDDDGISKALQAMCSKLRPGGLLIISTRDFDRALIERPSDPQSTVIEGPPRRVFVRLHEWDGPDSPFFTVRFFVLTEDGDGWTFAHHCTRYRAISSAVLAGLVEAAGFSSARWLDSADTGFHQPVLAAVRAPSPRTSTDSGRGAYGRTADPPVRHRQFKKGDHHIVWRNAKRLELPDDGAVETALGLHRASREHRHRDERVVLRMPIRKGTRELIAWVLGQTNRWIVLGCLQRIAQRGADSLDHASLLVGRATFDDLDQGKRHRRPGSLPSAEATAPWARCSVQVPFRAAVEIHFVDCGGLDPRLRQPRFGELQGLAFPKAIGERATVSSTAAGRPGRDRVRRCRPSSDRHRSRIRGVRAILRA